MSLVLKYSFVFILLFSVAMPLVLVNANVAIDAKIENPLGTNGPKTLPDFIAKAITIVMYVGVPLLIIAVIYAGFLYVKAQGNAGELEVAHRTLLYTIIGGFLLLGAFVIAKAIGDTVNDIRQNAS